jgi:CHASE3 domain sensor protein
MALTEEQERQWIAQLEGMGETQVRKLLSQDKISPAFVYLSSQWLAAKELGAELRSEASQSEQMELIRRASAAAEAQAREARRANTRATIALIIAILSIIVSAIGTLSPYWPHK